MASNSNDFAKWSGNGSSPCGRSPCSVNNSYCHQQRIEQQRLQETLNQRNGCCATSPSSSCRLQPNSYCSSRTSSYCIRPTRLERLPDGSVRYDVQSYPSEALNAMNNFRKDGHMCDVTLEIQGERIPAHKIILAASSLYFRSMFTNGMIESDSKLVTIREPSIRADTMRTLVDFAYSQVIHVTQENVQALLTSSIFLEMSHVIEACSMFMEQQLHASNCISFSAYAKHVGCFDLEQKAKKFIEEHFCDVITYDEILSLEKEDFVELIGKDQLNIRCETEVFRAVVRWVKHDTATRKDLMEMLLQKVRLCCLAPGFLGEQLKKCSIIRELPNCEQLILKRVTHLMSHAACDNRPRATCKSQAIYLIGGFSCKTMESLDSFECYNPRTKKWNRLPKLLNPRSVPGVTSLKGLVYVLGGRLRRCNEDFDSPTVSAYDPIENSWTTRSSMLAPKSRVGVAILDNFIYTIGGRTGMEVLRSAERYDPDTDHWTSIAAMGSTRMGLGVAVVNRLIYAVGGMNASNQRLSSVECYHPERNEWDRVEPMKCPRSGAGVAVLNDYIYVAGGFDGVQQLQSVERYDVKRRVWEEVASLPQARTCIQLVAVGNKLYTLGGYDGTDYLASVQSFDPCTNSWYVESSMLSRRSGHGVVVSVIPDHL